ncbi:Hypothetical protein A7982_06205 [Minicystis rosea]|nr:Hypothetical protein A7982_06205 [Minicystis rosea]
MRDVGHLRVAGVAGLDARAVHLGAGVVFWGKQRRISTVSRSAARPARWRAWI